MMKKKKKKNKMYNNINYYKSNVDAKKVFKKSILNNN